MAFFMSLRTSRLNRSFKRNFFPNVTAGAFYGGARPEFNDHVLVIEDYAAEPVRLQNVEKR